MPGGGFFARELPRWLYAVLAVGCITYVVDRWTKDRSDMAVVERVRNVPVRHGAGRGAYRMNWVVVDLKDGARFETPASAGSLHAGDTLLVERTLIFGTVRRYRRPAMTIWSYVEAQDDALEMQVLVFITGIVALVLLVPVWSEDQRTGGRVVLLLLLVILSFYLLAMHGPRFLSSRPSTNGVLSSTNEQNVLTSC